MDSDDLTKKVAELGEIVQAQQQMIEMLVYFCEAVAAKDGKAFLSYHQFYSPFPEHKEKILVLLEKVLKFLQDAAKRDWSV